MLRVEVNFPKEPIKFSPNDDELAEKPKTIWEKEEQAEENFRAIVKSSPSIQRMFNKFESNHNTNFIERNMKVKLSKATTAAERSEASVIKLIKNQQMEAKRRENADQKQKYHILYNLKRPLIKYVREKKYEEVQSQLE